MVQLLLVAPGAVSTPEAVQVEHVLPGEASDLAAVIVHHGSGYMAYLSVWGGWRGGGGAGGGTTAGSNLYDLAAVIVHHGSGYMAYLSVWGGWRGGGGHHRRQQPLRPGCCHRPPWLGVHGLPVCVGRGEGGGGRGEGGGGGRG